MSNQEAAILDEVIVAIATGDNYRHPMRPPPLSPPFKPRGLSGHQPTTAFNLG